MLKWLPLLLLLACTGTDDVSPLGEACNRDADCFSGWCKLDHMPCVEEGPGCEITPFPEGQCTQECELQDDCGYPLGLCLHNPTGPNYCIQGCYPESEEPLDNFTEFFGECREGYTCAHFGFPPIEHACWPES